MNKLNNKFEKLLESNKFLIMLHRGAHGGVFVENTDDAVNIAQKQGADIVEIDIVQSTDGDFFVFHDGEEERLLKEKRNINTLSTKEIESLSLHNEISKPLNKKVQRLSELLGNISVESFINIDRSWPHWESFIPYLDQFSQYHEYMLLKSPVKKEYLDILDNHPVKYMYFPIINNEDELDLLESYERINLVGFEVIDKNPDLAFYKSNRFEKYRNKKMMFMANAIDLDDETILFGPLTDRLALTVNPDLAWGEMVKSGINCIQTDWVDLLYRYREGIILK